MASTAIPAVRAAVLETLEAAEGLEGIEVSGGLEPTRVTDYVWVWKATATREFRSLGPTPPALDEEINIHLRIVAIRRDIGTAEEAATKTFEAVEATLRAAPTLNDVVRWQRIGKVESEPLDFDQKVGFHYLPVLSARARI